MPDDRPTAAAVMDPTPPPRGTAMQLRTALAAFGIGAVALVGAPVVDVATSPVTSEAQAAPNKVCHNGPRTDRPVQVLEADTGTYDLYPGDCTDGVVAIHGFRPPGSGWKASYKRGTSDTVLLSTYKAGQWTATLGQDISVTKVYAG